MPSRNAVPWFDQVRTRNRGPGETSNALSVCPPSASPFGRRSTRTNLTPARATTHSPLLLPADSHTRVTLPPTHSRQCARPHAIDSVLMRFSNQSRPSRAPPLRVPRAITRDPERYPDPHAFQPERILPLVDPAASPAAKARILDPRAYAFGYGRRCVPSPRPNIPRRDPLTIVAAAQDMPRARLRGGHPLRERHAPPLRVRHHAHARQPRARAHRGRGHCAGHRRRCCVRPLLPASSPDLPAVLSALRRRVVHAPCILTPRSADALALLADVADA